MKHIERKEFLNVNLIDKEFPRRKIYVWDRKISGIISISQIIVRFIKLFLKLGVNNPTISEV